MKKAFNINLDTIITQNPSIDSTDINGDKVMMDLDKGQYFAMNTVSSKIWEVIENPSTIKDIVSVLRNEYDVEEEKCISSVKGFIEKLYTANLIEIK